MICIVSKKFLKRLFLSIFLTKFSRLFGIEFRSDNNEILVSMVSHIMEDFDFNSIKLENAPFSVLLDILRDVMRKPFWSIDKFSIWVLNSAILFIVMAFSFNLCLIFGLSSVLMSLMWYCSLMLVPKRLSAAKTKSIILSNIGRNI